MSEALTPVEAPPPPPGHGGRDTVRTVVRGVGQLLITVGVVVLLFVVYEVYVTDLFGSQKQAAATEAIDQVWAGAEATTTDTVVVTDPNQLVTDPRQRTPKYETLSGEGFAKLYIPAF